MTMTTIRGTYSLAFYDNSEAYSQLVISGCFAQFELAISMTLEEANASGLMINFTFEGSNKNSLALRIGLFWSLH